MAKKKKGLAEPKPKDTFMQMFVTLSLILLAFFILLNSMATPNDEKKRKALGSLLGSFGIMPGADSIESSEMVGMKSKSVIPSDEMALMFESAQETVKRLLTDDVLSEEDVALSFDKEKGSVRVILAESLLFTTGRAVISPRLFTLLDNVSGIAKIAKGKTVVVGHTDDKPAGRLTSNWELSLERGTIVARHMESSGLLPRGTICSSGAAHYSPRESNKTEAGRAANRRVEILINTKQKE